MFGLEFSGVIGAGKIDASMTVDGAFIDPRLFSPYRKFLAG